MAARTPRRRILERFRYIRRELAQIAAYLGEIQDLSGGRPERLLVHLAAEFGVLGLLQELFDATEKLYRGSESEPIPSPDEPLPGDPGGSSCVPG